MFARYDGTIYNIADTTRDLGKKTASHCDFEGEGIDSGQFAFRVSYAGGSAAACLVTLQPDRDADGIADGSDNCINIANAHQRDTNGDGYGNACDADFKQDCVVNVQDLGTLRQFFFSNNGLTDLNGDGATNVVDLGILRALFFTAPGPTGVANDCD